MWQKWNCKANVFSNLMQNKWSEIFILSQQLSSVQGSPSGSTPSVSKRLMHLSPWIFTSIAISQHFPSACVISLLVGVGTLVWTFSLRLKILWNILLLTCLAQFYKLRCIISNLFFKINFIFKIKLCPHNYI